MDEVGAEPERGSAGGSAEDDVPHQVFLATVSQSSVVVAKDLGVFTFAGAVPFPVAPALAPAILALGEGRCSVLFMVAAACAALGAVAILPVKGVR